MAKMTHTLAETTVAADQYPTITIAEQVLPYPLNNLRAGPVSTLLLHDILKPWLCQLTAVAAALACCDDELTQEHMSWLGNLLEAQLTAMAAVVALHQDGGAV